MFHIQDKHSGAETRITIGCEVKLVYDWGREVDLYHRFGENPSDDNRNTFSDFHLDKVALEEFRRRFINYLI